MKNKSINIAEIARLANVHPSTVSRTLNGSSLVKEETRLRIEEIAKEHGYIPDAVAKSLSIGKTSTLGIIVPEISNSFYAHIVDTIAQITEQRGYSLIICGSRKNTQTELNAVRTLVSKRVDALVVCSPDAQTISHLKSLSHRIPVILCDIQQSYDALDCVRVDAYQGITSAVKHLKARGHTKIGCLADCLTGYRCDIFRSILEQEGLPVYPEYLFHGQNLAVQSGYQGLHELAKRGDLPTAIFAARDNIAIGAMRAAIELGLDIPGQLALVGYDDLSISNYLYKSLTTIRQPAGAIGENVAELLLRRLENKAEQPDPVTKHLIPELVIREST